MVRFSVAFGFDRTLVFLVGPPKSAADFKEGKVQKNILELYGNHFGITLHII